jgi:tetratricopeptide (TPR) repeat protein
MTLADLFVAIFFSVLLFISGCSSVGSEFQAGRNALQTGRANDAVGYLTQAAAADPNYKIPYRVQVSVLAYLGRAYLETGKATEARQTLERAVKLDNDDPLAHLYLGIAMLKTGEVERGRKEIEVGLRAIDDTLEYIQADLVSGFYWDPNMQIRDDVRKTLAAKLNDSQLIMAGERIGAQFDEEIDKARRDEGRGRGGGGGDGGGGGS